MSEAIPPLERTIVKLRVPREGQYWLLVAVVFLATGVFKSISLVALLACVMAAGWVVNAVGARRRLRRLRVRRWIECPVFARTPIAVDVEVTHRGKRPVVSLRLEDLGPDHILRWFVPWLRRGESVRYRREVFLPRRGWYAWEPLRAVSGYPFGLAEGVVSTEPVAPVVAYPPLRP